MAKYEYRYGYTRDSAVNAVIDWTPWMPWDPKNGTLNIRLTPYGNPKHVAFGVRKKEKRK